MEKSLYKIMMLSVVSVLGVTTSYGSMIVPDNMTKKPIAFRSVVAKPLESLPLESLTSGPASTFPIITQVNIPTLGDDKIAAKSAAAMVQNSVEDVKAEKVVITRSAYFANTFHRIHYTVRDSVSAFFSRVSSTAKWMLGFVWSGAN